MNILHSNQDGRNIWCLQNGEYHRDGGPAIEEANGIKRWYQQGKKHREDGPAVESADGTQQWWFKGKQLNVSSQEEFIRHLKLKAFW